LPFKIVYHPDVRDIDIPSLNARLKNRLRKAIEERLVSAPHHCGEPLRKTLKGYWKLRVGDYRVVFKIAGDDIQMLGIIHRNDVY
jgi:mRNA interferase RelE/StbE